MHYASIQKDDCQNEFLVETTLPTEPQSRIFIAGYIGNDTFMNYQSGSCTNERGRDRRLKVLPTVVWRAVTHRAKYGPLL